MKIPRLKFSALTVILTLTILVGIVVAASRMRPIVLGQTEGWADGELVVFDYTQNFFCANAPLNEDNCLVGAGFDSGNVLDIDPADIPNLIVIVPFFDEDNDGILDAFDPTPGVFVQCPETSSSLLAGGTPFGQLGHCILHDNTLNTAPLAGVTIPTEVGNVTFGGNISLPSHTHIVGKTPGGSVPWDTFVVLVLDSTVWPDENGNCPAGSGCLTSFDAIASAPAGSVVGGPSGIPTTLVLFFGVHGLEP